MYDPFMSNYGPLTPENNEKLSDVLSGIYNAGFSTGVIIGPLIGSYLTIWLDYGKMNDIMGFFGIGFGIVHLLFVYIPKRMALKNKIIAPSSPMKAVGGDQGDFEFLKKSLNEHPNTTENNDI